MIINTDQIEKLIQDKSITGYSIHKATGISQTAISRLRQNPERIDNITLDTAKQLQKFIDKND
ncbi:helix-turn-helix domain-containing protein [Dolosigranulum savutiense]|uniref:Helix-turn-helix domain-containing protein n=1 Tax=Dolosigranulum savutiense TaxID=3110288 RepID=A0AB74TWI5_9LACT